PLTDVRSVPKTGLARPPPTQQTARKGRLNFLYALAPAATATAPESWQIGLHGIISLLAYSTLSVASLVAILMAVQEHALRHHRPLPFLHALPLTLTEALLFQLMGVGFILLGLSLVTGLLFVEDMLPQ